MRCPPVSGIFPPAIGAAVTAVMRDLTGDTAIDRGVGEAERTDEAGGLPFVWKRQQNHHNC